MILLSTNFIDSEEIDNYSLIKFWIIQLLQLGSNKNANLNGSQALVNTTVKQNVKMITPLYIQVEITATGNIIEFIEFTE